MEKIKTLATELEIFKISNSNTLEISFRDADFTTIENAFSVKSQLATVELLSELGEKLASFVGYKILDRITKNPNFVIDETTGEIASIITVVLQKEDETQARISELESEVIQLNSVIETLLLTSLEV